MRHRTFALFVTAALAAVTAACGEGATGAGAKAPQGAAPPPVAGGQGVVATPGGAQYAMNDAPTSGEPSNRPRMNATAAAAYSAGMRAFQAGDLESAKAQFVKATEADSHAYQAQYSLGVVRERLGEVSGALTAYRQAISIVPEYEPAIAAYGVLLGRTQKTSEAESFLQQQQSKMPKSAAVTAALAEVKSIKGESAEAQRLAQEALKKNPDYRPAMVTIARDHYRGRRLDLALYTLKAILDGFGEENPPRDRNNADALLLRGLIYKEQGLRGPALSDLKRAVELRPDLVEARVHLATYLLESGNVLEATRLLEGAVRYDRTHVYAHMNLGDAYRLLGKTADAKRELEWVAAKDPTMAQVHYDLGLLYLFSENVPGLNAKQSADRAIDEFEQYKKMRPRSTGPDDSDELITRAKTKKALIEEQEKAPAAAAPAASTTPAGGAAGKMPAAAVAPSGGGSSGKMPPSGGAPSGAPSAGAPSGTAPAKPPASGSPSGGAPSGGSGSGSTGKLPPPPPEKK